MLLSRLSNSSTLGVSSAPGSLRLNAGTFLSKARSSASLGGMLLSALLLPSCLMDIAELQEDGGLGGLSCLPDQKACGGSCVSISDPSYGCSKTSCASCEGNASFSCDTDANSCVIKSCNTDWVDCDGVPQNGCEVSFAATAPAAGSTTEIPYRMMVHGEDELKSWLSLPGMPISKVCPSCTLPPDAERMGLSSGSAPTPRDMRAVARFAWDEGRLYFFAQVQDDKIVEWAPGFEPPGTGGSSPELFARDVVELVVDSRIGNPPSGGPQDGHMHQLLFGLAAGSDRIDVNGNDSNYAPTSEYVKSTAIRYPGCYFIQATLETNLFGVANNGQGVQTAPPSRTDQSDESGYYRMGVVVNDWDEGPKIDNRTYSFDLASFNSPSEGDYWQNSKSLDLFSFESNGASSP